MRYIAQGHTAGRGFSWCFSPLVLFGQQTYVSSRVKILYVSEEGQEANEGMGWGAGRPGTHDILTLHGCSEGWSWLPATPRAHPLWPTPTIADTCLPHQHFRLTTKGDQNFRTENRIVVGGEDGKGTWATVCCKCPHPARRDCTVHNLPNGRSSPETQQDPCPHGGGCAGGFADPPADCLGHVFPQNRGEALPQKIPSLLSCVPLHFSPPHRPAQPCTQWDSHSHLVLWRHLWLGRAWC